MYFNVPPAVTNRLWSDDGDADALTLLLHNFIKLNVHKNNVEEYNQIILKCQVFF